MSDASNPLATAGRRLTWPICLALTLATGSWDCGGRVQPNDDEDPPRSQVPRANFLEAVQTAICDAAEGCCAKAGRRRHAECRAQVQTVWQPKLDHADEVNAIYDPVQAGICVAEMKTEWTNCAPNKVSTSRAEALCARVFSSPAPRQVVGAPCFATMDCQQDQGVTVLCLIVNGSFPGTCMRHELGAKGARCGGAEGDLHAECQAPLICGADHTCQERLGPDEPCRQFKSDACALGLVCDAESSGVCVPALAVGAAASADSRCEGYCRVDDTCRICPDLPIWSYCE